MTTYVNSNILIYKGLLIDAVVSGLFKRGTNDSVICNQLSISDLEKAVCLVVVFAETLQVSISSDQLLRDVVAFLVEGFEFVGVSFHAADFDWFERAYDCDLAL